MPKKSVLLEIYGIFTLRKRKEFTVRTRTKEHVLIHLHYRYPDKK